MKKRRFFPALCLLLALCTVLCSLPAAAESGLDNFQKIRTCEDGRYTDVPASSVFAANIRTGYEYGIMEGYGSSFRMNSSMTRLAGVIIACRLNCIYETGADTIRADYTGSTKESYTAYAKAHGIFCGFSDLSSAVTRAEFAQILASALPDAALAAKNTVEPGAIPDVPEAAGYAADVLALYRAGVLTGSDDAGSFRPDKSITRAAACAIATRMALPSLRRSMTLTVTPVCRADGVNVEKIWSYSDSAGQHLLFVVRNTGEETACITVSVQGKTAAGGTVSFSGTADGVGPGRSYVVDCVSRTAVAAYTYTAASKPSSFTDVLEDLAITYTDSGTSFVQTASNLSGTDARFVEYFVLYFSAGKVAGCSYGFLNSVSYADGIGAGSTASETRTCPSHTSYQAYCTAVE